MIVRFVVVCFVKIVFCCSCGFYRHIIAECQDSWKKNIVRWKTSAFNVNLGDQTDEDKLKGGENRNREPLEPGELCGVPVYNKLLTGEGTQLMIEIRNLKAKIKEIKAINDKEMKRQKEEVLQKSLNRRIKKYRKRVELPCKR